MKRLLIAGALLAAIYACATVISKPPVPVPGVVVIYAQTLPYTLTVAWDPYTGASGFNCYLDGAIATSVTTATATSCQFPVTTIGPHTVGVTAVWPNNIPSETAVGTCTGPPLTSACTFTLQIRPVVTGIRAH